MKQTIQAVGLWQPLGVVNCMTKQELTEYWQELAKDSVIPKEKLDAVLEALGDESVSKAFQKGFQTQSEFSRGLDKNRTDWEEKLTASEETKARMVKWYNETAEPAFKQNQAGVAELKRYIDKFGTLDENSDTGADPSPTNGAPQKDAFTRSEFEESMKARDRNIEAVMKNAMVVSAKHLKEFDEYLTPEQIAEVEKVVVDTGLPLDKAYDTWTAPRREQQKIDALEAKHKVELEQVRVDTLSKHNLPVENREPKEHIFFNPAEIDKTVDADQGDRNSRNEFAAGWNEA